MLLTKNSHLRITRSIMRSMKNFHITSCTAYTQFLLTEKIFAFPIKLEAIHGCELWIWGMRRTYVHSCIWQYHEMNVKKKARKCWFSKTLVKHSFSWRIFGSDSRDDDMAVKFICGKLKSLSRIIKWTGKFLKNYEVNF